MVTAALPLLGSLGIPGAFLARCLQRPVKRFGFGFFFFGHFLKNRDKDLIKTLTIRLWIQVSACPPMSIVSSPPASQHRIAEMHQSDVGENNKWR